MSELIPLLRAIIQDELRALRLGDVGVVSKNEPHTGDGDAHNHTCDVKLRDQDVDLKKVPICAPHLGVISAPQVGELVLLSYVGGDPSRPIVIGRLYSDEFRPPLHEEKEWRVQVPLGEKTEIAIDKDASVIAASGDTKVTLKKDGSVEIEGKEDLKVKVSGNVQIECADATIKASGNISLGEGGGGVITTMSHKCFYTGAPLVGSQTVTAKG